MKRVYWLVSVIVVILATIFVLFYQSFGLRGYIALMLRINRLEHSSRVEAQEALKEVGQKGAIWGIYAGSYLDKVWMWGDNGLVSYPVSEFTTYSIYDGCKPETIARFDSGIAKPEVPRVIISEYGQWRSQASVGEYGVIFLGSADQGMEGVVKELYLYNFWAFLPKTQGERCAKLAI